jgi:hypothetical protein
LCRFISLTARICIHCTPPNYHHHCKSKSKPKPASLIAHRYPALYRNGIDNRSFGVANFLGWLCVGVWTSLCVYAFALWVPQVGEVRD